MALTSEITPYNPHWPEQYQREISRLAPVFDKELADIHHIGSTAIPGLHAKPEIDIVAVVKNIENVDQWSKTLKTMGYRRGGDLSEGHLFYKREHRGVRTHKLHVCISAHPKISEMLEFRNFLRNDRKTRDAYQALKLKLERENTRGIAEYLQGKEPFIRAVLEYLE